MRFLSEIYFTVSKFLSSCQHCFQAVAISFKLSRSQTVAFPKTVAFPETVVFPETIHFPKSVSLAQSKQKLFRVIHKKTAGPMINAGLGITCAGKYVGSASSVEPNCNLRLLLKSKPSLRMNCAKN